MDRAQVAEFTQGLRGSQAVILWVFVLLRGAAQSIDDLKDITGVSKDALQVGLDALMVKGRMVKQVGQHGKVWYLPKNDSFFAELEQSFFLPAQNPVFADSGATTTTLINNKQLTSGEVVEAASQNPVFAESVAACRAAGIGEPKASKLSALPWATPDFIRSHVAALGAKDVIGLAIVRIENNEAPPIIIASKALGSHPNGHPDYCRCHQCSMKLALVNAMQICSVCWQEECDDHD